MVGILSYGVYIPRYRLTKGDAYKAMGWFNPAIGGFARGEKAVANYDEDAITLGVEAARLCKDREKVQALLWASTTPPYLERQNSTVMATALGLPETVETSDFTGSLRAGTSALIAALDSVAAGRRSAVMTVASDSRLAKVASAQEHIFGDGGAAVVVGEGDVVASFLGSYSVSCDFVDHRRMAKDQFGKTWEDRWIRDLGYGKLILDSLAGLLKEQNISVQGLAKVVFPCPYPAVRKKIAAKLGIDPSKVKEEVHQTVGDVGAATPLIMLTSALDQSSPGDLVAVVGYGNGAQALLFRVEEAINHHPKTGWQKALNRKRELSYERYLAFKKLVPVELGIRGEEIAPTAISATWRERKAMLGLVGSQCTQCGTPVYPPQKVCVNPECRATGQMEEYPFAERAGSLFTYTADNLAFSWDPPALYGIVDFEGGGRYWFDLTDCSLEELKVGMKVRMTFRRKYSDENRSIVGYFWKATPVLEGGE
jgi:hydroxymethylglutaryl-CoA synthase